MEKKAKIIKKIQMISNTILANGCYSGKEMETQINLAEKRGNITEKEKNVICQAWSLRNHLANQLLIELEDFIKKVKKNDRT